MGRLKQWEEEWLRPFLFYGNNWISLIGGAITTAAAFVLLGYWVVALIGHGGTDNPYTGIIFDFLLPALFVLGLVLIPVGMGLRRRSLYRAGQIPSVYPQADFRDPKFRHAVDFVIVATFINFVIVGTASYRGVAYMDQASFCGTSCHVMQPEWVAYHHSQFHTNVACVECHVAPGIPGYIHAKTNGTKQLLMVLFHRYPRPILADNKLPPPTVTCERCHSPTRYVGDQLVVKNSFGDDEKNTLTHTVLVMHVGGRNAAGVYSGIHGSHYKEKIEYIATDASDQTIPWVAVIHPDGTKTVYSVAGFHPAANQKPRVMGCIDCHNRAAHSFASPGDSMDRAMAGGALPASLPYLHKEGMALIQANYASQSEAATQIPKALEAYYRTNYPAIWSGQSSQVKQAGQELVALYEQNVFPFMKVTWGTHPNNIGHMASPGCFRCHDGNHVTTGGAALTNDCTVCHNIVAMGDPNPKPLAELGMTQ